MKQLSHLHHHLGNNCIVTFRIGRFIFINYGLFVTLGFLAGVSLLYLRCQAMPISDGLFFLFLIGCCVSIVVGSRLLSLFSNPRLLFQNPAKAIRSVGFSFFGGFFPTLLFVYYFCNIFNLNLFVLFDYMSLSMPLSYSIGRLGCLSFGCCHGKPTNWKYGLKVVNTDLKSIRVTEIPQGTILFPTQTIATIIHFCFFVFLNILAINVLLPTGVISITFLMLFGLYRFFMEFTRGETKEPKIGKLTLFQFFAMACIVLGFFIIYHLITNAHHHNYTEATMLFSNDNLLNLLKISPYLILISLCLYIPLSLHINEIGKW